MELKAGYKQTEVGIIPEAWEIKTIKSVCRLINGRGFKPFEWKDTGLPIIRIQNLNGSDDFNFYQGRYDKKIEVENGQLLFAWSGSRGTSFGPHIWTGNLGLLNYHTWKVQINESEIDKNFFLYALKKLTAFIEDKAHGASALVHTQKWEMESFEFPTPPTKTEQTAIATALSDTDALINALDKLIAKKRLIKQGAMQELLSGKKRLAGFSGKWEVTDLFSVCNEMQNGVFFKPSNKGFGIKIINVSDLYIKTPIDESSLELFNATNSEKERFNVKNGDLFFTRSSVVPSGIAHCNIYQSNKDESVVFDSHVIRVRPNKNKIVSSFLFRFCLSLTARNYLISHAKTGTMTTIDQQVLAKCPVFLPTIEEQTAIAQILSDMDNEIAALEKRRAKTLQIKHGMMQELLTGKTRLI